ncbi:hypothetical protein Tco_0664333, partial [Tanacetum coccineum]
MKNPITTTTSNSQMHNDIMAAGSRERPPMLATGRYAQVLVPAKPETDPPVPEHTVPETYENTLHENRAYIDAEAEAIHMILSGIGDDIYSTIDACTTTKEIWTSIERLQQDLDKESYHKLFDLLKQYHNKVNEIRAKKLARNANPLALVQKQRDRTGHFGNQRTVAGARKTIRNQGDWLDDTDEEPDEQELEAYYMYMAKIQEVLTTESGPTFDVEPLEHADQNAEEYEDERVVLANLIANLKLD